MNQFDNTGYIRLIWPIFSHSYWGTTPTVLVYTPVSGLVAAQSHDDYMRYIQTPRDIRGISHRHDQRARICTTVATNALVERTSQPHTLLITAGFRDLFLIGNEYRPKIFDVNIRRPTTIV
jgi:hypothetical protein